MLVVATARPTFEKKYTSWKQDLKYVDTIILSPLDHDNSQKLIEAILYKVSEIPQILKLLVIKKAEGSPFYIEELIKMLIDDGIILKGEEKWGVDLQSLKELKIPSTLTGILQARFDSLQTEEKEILCCASTIGRVFWNQAIFSILEKGKQVQSVLQKLLEKEMFFRREKSTFMNGPE